MGTSAVGIVTPELPDTVNMPADLDRVATGIDAALLGRWQPDLIRMRGTAGVTVPAGNYTDMTSWTEEYRKGTSGCFSVAAGTVTLNTAGIYIVTLNITCTGGTSNVWEAKVYGSRLLCRATAPYADSVISAAAIAYLTVGTTIKAAAFNGSGASGSVGVDSASSPSGFSVLRIPGSA